MTESTAFFPVWMLIMAAFGFIIGRALGSELSRRRCAEERIEELHEQLEQAPGPASERQLKEIRSVMNDAHKHIVAVTKALAKRPS